VVRGQLQRMKLEFEFESRNFLRHGHRIDGCDGIVCWKHNWKECPLELIELSKEIEKSKIKTLKPQDAKNAKGWEWVGIGRTNALPQRTPIRLPSVAQGRLRNTEGPTAD